MNKKLEKIRESLLLLRKTYPELEEAILKMSKEEVKLPRLDFLKIVNEHPKEVIEFIENFYGPKVKLLYKKDLKILSKTKPKEDIQVSDLPNEVWKDIKNSNGYRVSNMGRVKKKSGKLAKINTNISGFSTVYVNNKLKLVHLLVGSVFVKKSKNKKYLVHIDGDKTNNKANNLRWVDSGFIKKGQIIGSSLGEIMKISIETGECIGKYKSTVEAAKKSGVNQSNLSKLLSASNGKRVKYRGFYWERKI